MQYQVIRHVFGKEIYRFRGVFNTKEEAVQSRRRIAGMSGGTIRTSDLRVVELKKQPN